LLAAVISAQEITNLKEKYEEYLAIEKENTEIMKRVRGEVSRYQQKTRSLGDNKDYTNMFENVISAYMNHNREIDYYPALVHLCGPFVNCIRNEAEVYYCFERLMNILGKQIYKPIQCVH
jgi:TBC1 domain family member 2